MSTEISCLTQYFMKNPYGGNFLAENQVNLLNFSLRMLLMLKDKVCFARYYTRLRILIETFCYVVKTISLLFLETDIGICISGRNDEGTSQYRFINNMK